MTKNERLYVAAWIAYFGWHDTGGAMMAELRNFFGYHVGLGSLSDWNELQAFAKGAAAYGKEHSHE